MILMVVSLMLSASAAMAAQPNSALVGGGGSNDEYSLEREIDGGIRVVADGVRHNGLRRGDVQIDGVSRRYRDFQSVSIYCIVTTSEDTTIRVAPQNIYDNLGNEFYNIHDVLIGGQSTRDRFIIAGVPTSVEVVYAFVQEYDLASVFSRVSLSVNGQTLIFRNIPGKK